VKGFAWLLGICGLAAVVLGLYGFWGVLESGVHGGELDFALSFASALGAEMGAEMDLVDRVIWFSVQRRVELLLGGGLGFAVALLLGKAASRE
jgi:hypothetical protein